MPRPWLLAILTAVLVAAPLASALAADERLAAESEVVMNDRGLKPLVHDAANFLSLEMQGKSEAARRIIQFSRELEDSLRDGKTAEALRGVNFKAPFKIDCVGFDRISHDVTTLVYITTTENGPVAIKLYLYRYDNVLYCSHVEATLHWGELETMLLTVQRLPAPVTINISADAQP